MHLPSADHEWHIPFIAAFPKPLFVFFLLLPLDEHETSYLAASLSILNFSSIDLLIISPYLSNDTLFIFSIAYL